MKNPITIFFIMLLFCVFAKANAQQRSIYFVHGLGGDDFSFDRFANAIRYGASGFPARNVNVHTEINYDRSQEYGLQSAAARVIEQIANKPNATVNSRDNYIIAQSQGGIVSRKADMLIGTDESRRTFGGIVTIGSPHGGAMILNNRDSKLIPLANDACNILLKTSIQSGLAQVPLLKGLLWPITKRIREDFVNSLCEGIVPTNGGFGVVDVVAGHFKSAITESYKVGAAEINKLNTFHQNNSTNIKKIALYGTKDHNDIFWRVMHYFRESPNAEGAFSATNDQKGVDDGKKILMDYTAALEAERVAYKKCGLFNWCWNSQPYKDRIKALEQAVNFISNINTKWLDVIGASNPTYATNNTCVCTYESGGWFSFPSTTSCPSTTGNGTVCYTSETISSYANNIKPSDGVVLVESQKAFPGASYVLEMKNNSHMQERNSRELGDNFNKIFEGNYGEYFRLLRK